MALKSAICPACNEPHLLQSNGRMSIHDTKLGTRCGGPSTIKPAPQRDKPKTAMSSEGKIEDDPERQAAYDAAIGSRRDRYGREQDSPFDRRIYMTKGVQKLNGGSPGGGKRA